MMGVLVLGLIIGLIVWMVRGNTRSTQQRALAARMEYLETWKFEHFDNPWLTTWTAHLPTMRLRYEFVVTDSPGSDSTSDYVLRRQTSGGWDYQLTQESWLAEVHRIQDSVGRKAPFYEDLLKRLKELEGGPKWERFPDHLASSLEASYQRFIRQRAW